MPVIQGMCTNVRSRVCVNGQYSKEFGVGVGVHQGSILSPLLFILVLESLWHEFRTGVPWELLYADDLAVIADTLEECLSKLKAWKEGMENKGLRVNIKKTKLMVTGPGLDVVHFHVLSVGAALECQTQSSPHSALSGCIRGAAVSRTELLQTQTMSGESVVDKPL